MNSKTERAVMRGFALNYRRNLAFARQYREHNPPLYERWVIIAGMSLAQAIIARGAAQELNKPHHE